MHQPNEKLKHSSDDESSYTVRATFFAANSLAPVSEQTAQKNSQALFYQQQVFEAQYRRLQNICKELKKDTKANFESIPIFDQVLESTKKIIQFLNKLISSTDDFLREVAKYGNSHKHDITTLKNLTDDLAVTNELLTSPTAKNVSAFQERFYDEPKYKKDTKITDIMISLGGAFCDDEVERTKQRIT